MIVLLILAANMITFGINLVIAISTKQKRDINIAIISAVFTVLVVFCCMKVANVF